MGRRLVNLDETESADLGAISALKSSVPFRTSTDKRIIYNARVVHRSVSVLSRYLCACVCGAYCYIIASHTTENGCYVMDSNTATIGIMVNIYSAIFS